MSQGRAGLRPPQLLPPLPAPALPVAWRCPELLGTGRSFQLSSTERIPGQAESVGGKTFPCSNLPVRSRRKELGVCSGCRRRTAASEAAALLCGSTKGSFPRLFSPYIFIFQAGKGAGGGRGGEIILSGEREGIIIPGPWAFLEVFPPFSEGSADTVAIHGSAGGAWPGGRRE